MPTESILYDHLKLSVLWVTRANYINEEIAENGAKKELVNTTFKALEEVTRTEGYLTKNKPAGYPVDKIASAIDSQEKAIEYVYRSLKNNIGPWNRLSKEIPVNNSEVLKLLFPDRQSLR